MYYVGDKKLEDKDMVLASCELTIALLIFFIAQGSVQLSLHQLLKNVLEAFLEEGIDISHTV